MAPRDPTDPKSIDETYGLEPVFEPGAGDEAHPTDFVTVQCPYCGEAFETAVDVSGGSFSYVEDCQVCCQAIELAGEVDESGSLVGLTVARSG
jgi:hypothetical protein